MSAADLLLETRDILAESGGGRGGISYQIAPFCLLGGLREASVRCGLIPQSDDWDYNHLDRGALTAMKRVIPNGGTVSSNSIWGYNDWDLSFDYDGDPCTEESRLLPTEVIRERQLDFLDQAIRFAKDADL